MSEQVDLPYPLDWDRAPFCLFKDTSPVFQTFIELRFISLKELEKLSLFGPKKAFEILRREYFVWLCSGITKGLVPSHVFSRVEEEAFRKSSDLFSKLEVSCIFPTGNPPIEIEIMKVMRPNFQFKFRDLYPDFLPSWSRPPPPKFSFPLPQKGSIFVSKIDPNEEEKQKDRKDLIQEFIFTNPFHKINFQEHLLRRIPFIDQVRGKEKFILFEPISRKICMGHLNLIPTRNNTYGFICDSSMNQMIPPYQIPHNFPFYFIPTSNCLKAFDCFRDNWSTDQPTFPLTLGLIITLLNEHEETPLPLLYDPQVKDLVSACNYILSRWNPFPFISRMIHLAARSTWQGPAGIERVDEFAFRRLFDHFVDCLGFSIDIQFYPPNSNKKPILKTSFWLQGPDRIKTSDRGSLGVKSLRDLILQAAIKEQKDFEDQNHGNTSYSNLNWQNEYLEIFVGNKISFYLLPGDTVWAEDKSPYFEKIHFDWA